MSPIKVMAPRTLLGIDIMFVNDEKDELISSVLDYKAAP
jgi:hypothetical protein